MTRPVKRRITDPDLPLGCVLWHGERMSAAASLENALRQIQANDPAGVQCVRDLASAGEPRALFLLAELYWSGTLVPQDPVRGRQLFEAAGARGHVGANLIVTNLLASGVAGARNWPMAIERLQVEAARIPSRRAALELLQSMRLDSAGNPAQVGAARIISEQPDARLFERLLTREECEYLIAAAGEFEPSMVYDAAGQLVEDTIRTSHGAAFHWDKEDPLIHAINRRIAAASGTAYDAGEALQVLRYSPGQEYRPHYDWINNAANQRLWTALLYLNDGYQGGATCFVRVGKQVDGRTGDVLLFNNAQPDGNGDPLAEHAGMPVTQGTKYLATRWIRQRRWIP